jgi:uncharacterized protein YqjF (DUF2071 family)
LPGNECRLSIKNAKLRGKGQFSGEAARFFLKIAGRSQVYFRLVDAAAALGVCALKQA